MADVAVAIIGAGVVGAAVAQRLAARRLPCVVLEAASRPGGEITARNSGVVHAGLYDPPGSLKARLCVAGARALYGWAARAGVPCARVGKLVVAADERETEALGALLANGRAAGAAGLSLLSSRELSALEPGLRGHAALYSEGTGIVDAPALAASLAADARDHGAEVLLAARVEALERAAGGWRLLTPRGELRAEAVVNAAGLHADEVAALAGVRRYRVHPCRGDWFRIRGRAPVRRLVYPVRAKGAAGLGVHLTLDLAGGCRLGPDAVYVSRKDDYEPAPEGKRAEFAAAARRLLPGIREDDLAYDTCGLRPKLRAPGEPGERDFVIAEDLPGLVNLVGIESPGLTAALAIAGEVERLLS